MSLIPEMSLELGALSGSGAMAKLSVPTPPRVAGRDTRQPQTQGLERGRRRPGLKLLVQFLDLPFQVLQHRVYVTELGIHWARRNG